MGNSTLRRTLTLLLAGGTLLQIGACIPAVATIVATVGEQVILGSLLGQLPVF